MCSSSYAYYMRAFVYDTVWNMLLIICFEILRWSTKILSKELRITFRNRYLWRYLIFDVYIHKPIEVAFPLCLNLLRFPTNTPTPLDYEVAYGCLERCKSSMVKEKYGDSMGSTYSTSLHGVVNGITNKLENFRIRFAGNEYDLTCRCALVSLLVLYNIHTLDSDSLEMYTIWRYMYTRLAVPFFVDTASNKSDTILIESYKNGIM